MKLGGIFGKELEKCVERASYFVVIAIAVFQFLRMLLTVFKELVRLFTLECSSAVVLTSKRVLPLTTEISWRSSCKAAAMSERVVLRLSMPVGSQECPVAV